MSVTLTHPIRAAATIGADHGASAATWFEINSDADARNVIDLDDNCELSDYAPTNPLAQETAGDYSEAELLRDCEVSEAQAEESDARDLITLRDSLSNAYSDAYYSAWNETVVSRAAAYLA